MALVPSLHSRNRTEVITAPISAFESEVAALIQSRGAGTNPHRILQAIAVMFALILLGATVLKLDIVVTSDGNSQIATEEGPLYVQPLQQSIVHQIMVKVGDVVKKGQVLATLDPTFAVADVTQLKEHLASDQALVNRLDAESQGIPYATTGDGKYERLQETQWRQRQEEYKQTIAGYDAQIANAKALLEQAQSDVAHYTTRARLNNEIATAQRTLANNGNASRLLADQAEDTYTEVMRLLGDARQQAEAQTATIQNLTAQSRVYIETWTDYIATNLVTTRNDLDQTVEALNKANKVNELITLVAPDDAVVLQIASASAGSVVQSSQPSATSNEQQPLFTLTPLHGVPEAMLEIDTTDIGFIRVGDTVTLKIDAYPYIRFGTAEGVVKTISEGSFTQEDNGTIRTPFFKVWVEVEQLHFQNVPKTARLIPGMTLSGDIIVGKRSILSYLIEGFTRTTFEAMREP